ncbi:hypothetical protein SDC9_132329 [bioreactor metagenome]|uniref:Uncharacterized protein n=1 Tax=bioreactor metagenome TaxID=1076179 RepID=A0A645D7M0_9ZZZZ
MCYDIKRIIKGDKGKQVQSRYIFDGVFIANSFGQLMIVPNQIAHGFYLADELGLLQREVASAFGIAGVQYSTVSKDHSG